MRKIGYFVILLVLLEIVILSGMMTLENLGILPKYKTEIFIVLLFLACLYIFYPHLFRRNSKI